MQSRGLRAFSAAVGLVLAGSSCSPATQTEPSEQKQTSSIEVVLDEVASLSGEERSDRLAELAAEEGGELMLYTSLASEIEDEVAGAFEDAYDISVSVFRADSESLVQRLREESDAGFEGADVAEMPGPEMAALGRDGILADYSSPGAETLVADADQEGWTIDRFNNFVVSWNTKDVAESERPQEWEDLADPGWEGRLAMEPSDIGWFKALWEYWESEGKSSDEIESLFEDMSSNALFIKGHTTTGTLLNAGEVSVAASNYSYIVDAAIADGADVAWKPPVEPVIALPFGVAPVSTTPHPATALLFVDWILTDGQEVLAELGVDPAREDLTTTAGIETLVVDAASLLDEQDRWLSRYEQLTSLGEVVDSP